MYLGGGTALAARWGHRHSTDVDLFATPYAYSRLYAARSQFLTDLRERVPIARTTTFSPHFARILTEDGCEISLSTSPPVTPDPISTDTVKGTDVQVETTAEILGKKLQYRMLHNAILVPRYLYDIVVAQRLDAESLNKALSILAPEDVMDIAAELGSLPKEWINKQPQRLVRPAYADIAVSAVWMVRRLLHQHLRRQQGWQRRGSSWER